MIFVLAALVGFGIALPHMVPLERAAPAVAVSMWLAALALRALTGVYVVYFAVFYVPETELFTALTRWCWHAVVPGMSAHLGFSGHQFGDAAAIAPAVALALSAVSVIWALTRAARAVQRQLRRLAVGPGPSGSVIVGGSSVVVAAAGISRPRVVVSAGALTAFDDAELAASVDHEHGHIARRHRFAVVFGELCRAVGRLVPGARRAIEELEFHLERDADEYAVARLHDPLDLASAICKAAGTGASRGAVLSLYGSRKVTHRVRLLTQDHGRISSDFVNRCATAAAVGMTTLVLALVVSIPAATAAGMSRVAAPADLISCPR